MQDYKMLIDGQWVDSSTKARIDTVNPYTGAVWATIPRGTAADADSAIRAARGALKEGPWGSMTAGQRGGLMRSLAELLVKHGDFLAQIETRDNGKPISETSAQLRAAPSFLHYYAGLADKIEGSVPPPDRGGLFGYTRREPIGVVVAIVPWNSPMLQVVTKLGPALAAGCPVVLKPSEFTSASALDLLSAGRGEQID